MNTELQYTHKVGFPSYTHRTAVNLLQGQRRKLSSVCDFKQTLILQQQTVLSVTTFFLLLNITDWLHSGEPQPEINAHSRQGEETFDWVQDNVKCDATKSIHFSILLS